MADVTEPEAPAIVQPDPAASATADTPTAKTGGVVTQRRVVSVALSAVDPKKAAEALAAASGPHQPQPRNSLNVSLQLMKRKHDRPGGRVASYMSDLKT